MVIGDTPINPSSVDDGGNGTRSTMELDSLAQVDLKEFSQSELYSLARSSSSDFDLQSPENIVIPKVSSDRAPPHSITTASPSRIFAFSHRRGPRRRISASENDEADPQMTENRLILSNLHKLIAEGEANDSNPRRDMVMVGANEGEVQKRKRRRKSKAAEENEKEFEGLEVINLNGEKIDLKFLARYGDGAFEAELNKMTAGLVGEDAYLGFVNNLEGRWGSSRKRRKYVDAAYFINALPRSWKILLSLRPRIRHPTLYCRRFVSPSDIHFKSCKEVAFYLKSQLVPTDANPLQERSMIKIEPEWCQVDLESVAQVTRSFPDTEVDLLETNNLCDVPIYGLIECHICRDSFTNIGGLESHMEKVHEITMKKLDTDTLTGKGSVTCDVVFTQQPKPLLLPWYGEMNDEPPTVEKSLKQKSVVEEKAVEPQHPKRILLTGEGSSVGRDASIEPKSAFKAKETLKTRCMWCLVDFIRESGGEETLTSSSVFKCPKCEEEIKQRINSTLSDLNQPADK